jgi:8-oxo-dGTP diphosphatase
VRFSCLNDAASMLTFISELPTDKPIAGAHCVPLLDSGHLLMVWDREERVLTTIGGRLEENETIEQALDREALEEAGVILEAERTPFASWYWTETDTYTIFFLTKVRSFVDMLQGYEKTGYVAVNFETAIDMIEKIEGRGERIEMIRRAGVLSGKLKKFN